MSGIVPYRRPLVSAVTIDGPNTPLFPFQMVTPGVGDLDDAVSSRRIYGGWVVTVHISNVASVIPVRHSLDVHALKLGFTRYRPGRTFHMFPNVYANDWLSLLPGQRRPALTIEMQLDDSLQVVATEVALTSFTSQARLCTKDVSKIFRDSSHPHHEQIRPLVEVGALLRAQRKQKRAVPTVGQLVTRSWFLEKRSLGDRIIQELMILANCQLAAFCTEHSIPIIYRNYDPDYDMYAWYGVENKGHFIAGGAGYTHATSPIRRAPDKVVQDQVYGWLRGGGFPRKEDELAAIADHVNGLAEKLRKSRDAYKWVFGEENGSNET
ncbi:MAG: RNB domain-containing ribonuclease [Candidatus Jacksonbacteria bacterium]|nr:RNB domain-containing ribonuclease [Candidatus Jacksonbacteria bacterium]MBT6757154.1 RNB domain-containing ribonuclease [Candidatus Jacksonbacteria bacterium]